MASESGNPRHRPRALDRGFRIHPAALRVARSEANLIFGVLCRPLDLQVLCHLLGPLNDQGIVEPFHRLAAETGGHGRCRFPPRREFSNGKVWLVGGKRRTRCSQNIVGAGLLISSAQCQHPREPVNHARDESSVGVR